MTLRLSRNDSLGKKMRAKAKREKKLKKKLKRKYSERMEKRKDLLDSNPEINLLVLNCQMKRAFATRLEAMRWKPRGLYIYECDVCMGYHFTSRAPINRNTE